MERKILTRKARILEPVTETKGQILNRRQLLKKILFTPFQGILFMHAITQKRAGANVVSSPASNPEKLHIVNPVDQTANAFTPNEPMGIAQGIFPGRVTWVWNPASTNPLCANTIISPDAPDSKYDGWFMDRNTNQEMVDQMLTAGLCSITGKEKIHDAWDAIFRYHNKMSGKGNIPYQRGEKIYIKLNRTSASSKPGSEFRRLETSPASLLSETSPQIVLSMLRQLVHVAGVPQESIYVGDAMREIYKDEYLKYYAEFPGVYYLSRFAGKFGRIQSVESSNDRIFYSDNNSIMKGAGSDKIYTVLEEAEYLINLAAMKGHGSAGISLCAKNHFGTQSRASAMHLHPGLNSKNRMGYGHYRVLVDLMANKYTGRKNLFYILDGLWAGSDWDALPAKFLMPPFNNHWSSSLLLSFDPVGIESVALDILRTEFSRPEHTIAHISSYGVDDYLHQAADSENWPKDIIYMPDGDGIQMAKSIGVHEHWNNPEEKQYSRNLGKGNGVELVKVFQNGKI